MRAWIVLLVLLPGCLGAFDHGCSEHGRHGYWTEPGAYDRALDLNWSVESFEASIDPELVAALGGEGNWWRVTRHWNEDESIRFNQNRGSIGGIVSQDRSDDEAAQMVAAFIWERLGKAVDGYDFLQPRPGSYDPFRLLEGTLEVTVDPASFLTLDGQWVPAIPGVWHYAVNDDEMRVQIPVAHSPYNSEFGSLAIDAANWVQGPYIAGPAVTDGELMAASEAEWARLGWPTPQFQAYSSEAQMVCT